MATKQTLPGRPQLPDNIKKKGVYVKLSPWVKNWLRAQSKSQGMLIEEALIKVYGLELPNVLKN